MGLELHVCTINKSVHTKKSGNLLHAPRKIYLTQRWDHTNKTAPARIRTDCNENEETLFTPHFHNHMPFRVGNLKKMANNIYIYIYI